MSAPSPRSLLLLVVLALHGCDLPSQECPASAEWDGASCACDEGTFGALTWDAAAELYDGECLSGVEMAVRSGDPSYVTDAAPLLASARADLVLAAGTHRELLLAIYGSDGVRYTPSIWSQHIRPNSIEENTTLVLGSVDGSSLAAIGARGDARYAAFGVDLLSSFADGSNSAFRGPFDRLTGWLRTGSVGAPPASGSVALLGLGGGEAARAWAEGLGWTAEVCAAGSFAGCAEQADLLVVGGAGGDENVAEIDAAVAAALQRGAPLLYLHTETWATSRFGEAVVRALDLSYGDYGGNYWSDDAADWADATDMVERAGSVPALLALIDHLAASDYDFDWSQCTEYVGSVSCGEVPGFREGFLDGAEAVQRALGSLDAQGTALFEAPGRRVWRLLALLGDVYRRDIAYPMDKESTDTTTFLSAYYADHAVHYGRSIQPPQEDLGTFSDGGERAVEPVGPTEVSIDVSRHGGFTAIGLYALPGEVVTIERLDGVALSAWVAVNTHRTGTTREFGADSYTRPKFLQSPTMPLVAGAPLSFASPYGGTLQLHVSGGESDRTLSLRVRGAARHEVLEFGGDVDAYAAALASSPFPYTEIRNPYVQIHSKTSMMMESIAAYEGDLDAFFDDLERYMIQDTYNLAGFVGEGLAQSEAVSDFCAAMGWDCADPAVHGKPAVQHIHVDTYAHCGGGCSGNPYDQAWPLGPLGWGESHEIGHNLQRGRIRIHGGRSSEVSNQLFPLHKHATYAADTGISLSPDRSPYEAVFDLLQDAFDDADPTASVYAAMWEPDGTYDNNGERMNFYLQLAHRSDDVGWLDSGWDVYTLMYLQDRLFERARRSEDAWDAEKGALGFETYADAPDMDGNDYMLLSSSFISERDQRPFFAMFGVPWSAEADAQLEAYGLEPEPLSFWITEDTNLPPLPDPLLIDGVTSWPL